MLREDVLREFGKELRRMRKEMKMTLEELASELGADFRMISRYENGQAEMGALMYRKLVQLHEQRTQPDSLLQQIQKMSPANRKAVETIVFSLGAR